jgi:hypothetical protein
MFAFKPFNVLIACEESQTSCKVFREFGCNAFSADLQRCSGGCPQWHILGDCLPLLDKNLCFYTQNGDFHFVDHWDLIIAHPPCTFLSRAGACNIPSDPSRIYKGFEAAEFFYKFYNSDCCDHICIENPVPISLFNLPLRSQEMQPYRFDKFGVHPFSKRTYIWLKNLPFLPEYTPFGFPVASWNKLHSSSKIRSKTFIGFSYAFAENFIPFLNSIYC